MFCPVKVVNITNGYHTELDMLQSSEEMCYVHLWLNPFTSQFDGLVQGCGNSSAFAMELPQSSIKPPRLSIFYWILQDIWINDEFEIKLQMIVYPEFGELLLWETISWIKLSVKWYSDEEI